MELPVLDPVGVRILGSLLEKQVTVPASYPLTLNSLRTACNQASSRSPVVDYDAPELEAALKQLRDQELVRVVWEDRGRRTLKYHQRLDDRLELADDERAVLTVLMLRGAQTPGELKPRTERLHAFADRADVQTTLERLAAREAPLVAQLPRQPGHHDRRWRHLLAPEEEPAAAAPIDREQAIADGVPARDDAVRRAYAAIAGDYAEQSRDELEPQTFEQWLLGDLVGQAPGPILDVGCGPGHVTARLAELGADVVGMDQSEEMLAQARAAHPEVRFEAGDLRRLLKPRDAAGWGAVLSWYSMIHLAGSELAEAVGGMTRVLDRGGVLLVALHAGTEVLRPPQWLGHDISGLPLVLHEPAEVAAAMTAAGLERIDWYRRGFRADRGESQERLYVVGHMRR